MMKIDIERLIDAIEEENTEYSNYCTSSKALYNGPFDELQKRKDHIKYCNNCHDRAQTAVYTIFEVFGFDEEQRKRARIAARAVHRWRIRTNWERLIPQETKERIARFIFGAPVLEPLHELPYWWRDNQIGPFVIA